MDTKKINMEYKKKNLFFNSESWAILVNYNKGFKWPVKDFNRNKGLKC